MEKFLTSDVLVKLRAEQDNMKVQKQITEQNFHQINGAIAILEKLIQEEMVRGQKEIDDKLKKGNQIDLEQENGQINDKS
jgi:hypothetical protein